MKHIVLIGDGMADHPLEVLDGKTPMTVAHKPYMNYLASHGINGTVSTVPEGMVPESDTANLALMGYDPKIYSKGRSPLEAMGMGIELAPNQTAIRANLVTLSDFGEEYAYKTMIDHSSGEITSEEARILIEHCDKLLFGEGCKLYPGVSYRHCLIYDDSPELSRYTRPHDIIKRTISEFLPNQPYLEIMKKSFDILNNHPVNLEREHKGLKKANSLWFWSPGKRPALPQFRERTGLEAAAVCAVDLIKGIALCAGMEAPFVAGATGTLHTDYTAKMRAALAALNSGKDLVYLHVEAPDECGHQGNVEDKITAIEKIDELILKPLLKSLDESGWDYKILLTPDHPTPLALRTHTREAVPFVIYDSRNIQNNCDIVYNEESGRNGSFYIENGEELMEKFINI